MQSSLDLLVAGTIDWFSVTGTNLISPYVGKTDAWAKVTLSEESTTDGPMLDVLFVTLEPLGLGSCGHTQNRLRRTFTNSTFACEFLFNHIGGRLRYNTSPRQEVTS